MKQFLDREFLLDTETARTLFHTFAEQQPIFDYHNHLSPRDIALHRTFRDLTELWLEGDHYKWRAMRACGVDEACITGNASPREKFQAWAKVLPKLAGSPLYHWTHLELQRCFGIGEPLNEGSAARIWEQTTDLLHSGGFDAVSLLENMRVHTLCTTDDPADTLEWHKQIAADPSIRFRVCPSFRPDRYLADPAGEASRTLCTRYQTADLDTALIKALDSFCQTGCLVSDHAFVDFSYDRDERLAARMRVLGRAYAARGVVMQLHLGAVRNVSPRLYERLGADAGGDSVGHTTDPSALGAFFADLERADALPRTILYNLNPADNPVLSTMAVNFAPRAQFGAAWWFNDHIRGIEAQLDELMETGALASSVGMLTDSRSFSSFVRHEYYRRILCRRLGRLVEEGLYPDDMQTLGGIVADVSFRNAERFFSAADRPEGAGPAG